MSTTLVINFGQVVPGKENQGVLPLVDCSGANGTTKPYGYTEVPPGQTLRPYDYYSNIIMETSSKHLLNFEVRKPLELCNYPIKLLFCVCVGSGGPVWRSGRSTLDTTSL